MAIKFGEAYYEIYPKINNSAVNLARATIGRSLADEFARSQRRIRGEDDKTTRQRVHNQQKVSKTNDRQVTNSSRVERALSDLRSKFSLKHLREAKKEEGAFHKLATQFRTIGTIIRGLAIGYAVLGGWNLLRISIGLIQQALPIVYAGIVALPAAVAAVGAEAVILKIAFHGVGTAIKDAFNPKKAKQFKEELKKLAPAARSFVLEIAKLKNLKLPNLQQAFFSATNVQKTAKQLVPAVKAVAPSAASVAGASGQALGGITRALTGKTGIRAVNALLVDMATNLTLVAPGLKKFTDGLLTLIRHVTEFDKGRVGAGLGKLLTRLGDFSAHVDVGKVFKKAGESTKTFISLGKDLWAIISNIVKAMNAKQAFGAFAAIIHTIAQFVQSGIGKEFLNQLFGTLNVLSSLASSLVGSALKVLASAFEKFYPAIKPVADILAKMGKDLIPLGPLIGTIVSAGFDLLTPVLRVLEPVLKLVVNDLASLATKPWFKVIAGGIIAIAAAWYILTVAFSISPIGWIVIGIVALTVAVVELVKHWNTIWKAIQDTARKVWGFLTHGLGQLALLVLGPIGALIFLYAHWKTIWHAILVAYNATWNALKTAFYKLRDFFTKTIPHWALKLRDWFVYAWNSIVNNLHKFWSAVANFFTGKVKGFFTKTIPGWLLKLRDWFVYVWNRITSGVHSWWSAVANFFTGKVKGFFTKTIPGWVGTFKGKILGAWDSVLYWTKDKWNKFKNFFTHNIKDFFVKTIPGWASKLSNGLNIVWDNVRNWAFTKWRAVYNTIRDIAQTLIDQVFGKGLGGAWGKLIKAGLGLAGNLLGAFSKIKIPRWGAHGLGKAEGGPIRGPGGPTDDMIQAIGPNGVPYRLSNGEFIIRASMYKKHPQLIEAINADRVERRASGGAVGAIEALQRFVGPGLRVTSTTGGNHAKNSYHYRGMAVDFAGSQRAMDVAANNLYKFSGYILELIHSPNWFVKNYRKVGRGTYASVYSSHFNHVHLAMSLAAAQKALKDAKSGKITGFGGFGPGGQALDPLVSWISSHGATAFFKPVYQTLDKRIKNSQFHALGKKPIDAAVTLTNKKVADLVAAAAAYNAQQGPTNLGRLSGQIGSWIGSASHYAYIPNSWISGLRYIISRESGGNPRAYNPISVGGWHAKGIMQMLWPTFKAHHAPGTSWDIYNPVANIASAARYIKSRYGSPAGTPWLRHTGNYYSQGGPVKTYDTGGVLKPGFTPVYNGTGRNEYIMTQDQLEAAHCNVTVIIDGVDVTNKAHVTVSNKALIRALDKRGGHRG